MEDFDLILQRTAENLLSVRRFDSVLVVGRLAQRLARLVYTKSLHFSLNFPHVDATGLKSKIYQLKIKLGSQVANGPKFSLKG